MIWNKFAFSLVFLLVGQSLGQTLGPAPTAPSINQQDVEVERLNRIADVVEAGIKRGQMPGAVVAIGYRGQLVYLKAFGHRQLLPKKIPMTTDTVFDLASLTKPLATGLSMMKLVENAQIKLDKPVADYWPLFGTKKKNLITVRQLLLHTSGLIADNNLKDYQDSNAASFASIAQTVPLFPSGKKFVYSDVGFIVLAKLVEEITGKSVDQFAHEHFFQPMSLENTTFNPKPGLRSRSAATEKRDGKWMVGEVHDPRSYRLGGVAGHAGLFSTAEDLAVICQMLIDQGRHAGKQILKSQTIERMIEPHETSGGLRALGWDIKSSYSSNRGDLFSDRAFGHGGFTGTSLWIDPEQDLYVIFLSNRLHPAGKGSVNSLAARIGTIAAASVPHRPQAGPKTQIVKTGIDLLQQQNFAIIKGKRVGLITNQTGINRRRQSTLDILAESGQVDLVAVFAPEHGLRGQLDVSNIADSVDKKTGLKVYSLYGNSRAPTKQQLQDIDVLVFDIQDIGTRYYTYISTLGLAMKAAAKSKTSFVVLDRPNPINGVDCEGPVLDRGSETFVGFHPIALRHGMTAGELARMFNDELKLKLDLQVVPVQGWQRASYFDQTGLPWVNPSPNIRKLGQAVLYPAVGMLETTNLSVGRGTDSPFEIVGAPWIDDVQFAAALNESSLPGVRFVPVTFTPNASKYKNKKCHGVNIVVTDRTTFLPVQTGLQLAVTLNKLYADSWDQNNLNALIRNKRVADAIRQGNNVTQIEQGYGQQLERFKVRRAKYLAYPENKN